MIIHKCNPGLLISTTTKSLVLKELLLFLRNVRKIYSDAVAFASVLRDNLIILDVIFYCRTSKECICKS
jgi:hypothetical protein